MQYRETMWGEMKPYVYGGESCEEHLPNWHTYASGDKQDGDEGTLIEFNAATFPPGTKIVVSEPVCPHCGEVPSRSTEKIKIERDFGEGEPFEEYVWTCCEAMNWRAWANDEYS